jgi:hypothetical protein
MDEDCERIRLRKDVRDDVVGSEEKKAQKKKTAAAGLLKATQEGLGGRKNKGKDLSEGDTRPADKTDRHWPRTWVLDTP